VSHDDARIAALEAQVARLTARLDSRSTQDLTDATYDRRALLRRSGLAALAGLGAAAAVPTVLASGASAANGDPVAAGGTTTATTTTTLNGNVPNGEVLRLANTATPDIDAHPVLNLAPQAGLADAPSNVGDAGDLLVGDYIQAPDANSDGGTFLYYAHTGPVTGGTNDVYWGNVYTSQFASFIELLPEPVRVLETRTRLGGIGKMEANTRVLVNLGQDTFGGNLAAAGLAKQTAPANLVLGGLGVIGNLTVVAPEGTPGHLTVYPGFQNGSTAGQQPTTSNLNFTKGQTLANFQIVGLNAFDSFVIWTGRKADILFDVIGFIVPDIGRVGAETSGGAQGGGAQASRLETRAQAGRNWRSTPR
jgi:hypothetical protein